MSAVYRQWLSVVVRRWQWLSETDCCQKRTVVRRKQGSDGSGLGVLRGFRAFVVLVRGIAFLFCDDGHSPLQRGIEVESCRSECSCGTGTQLYALDVLRGVELLLRFRSLFVLDADREDGEVGEFHVLALQQNLLDASDHVGEHPLDGAGGERRVVIRHVLGELVKPDGLVNDGVSEPFVVN